MLNLTFLPKLLKEIPALPPLPKTLFDIARFPRSENVNSNCLAYYLDEKEDHGLGRLFLDSLMVLAVKEEAGWPAEWRFEPTGDYTVAREESTQDSKRIDLQLRSKSSFPATKAADSIQEEENVQAESQHDSREPGWTIVIENKIDAWLYNDLRAYSGHIKTTDSLRIVLSPLPLKTEAERAKMQAHHFIHVTHRAWMDQVKAMLPAYTQTFTSHPIFLLEEFLRSIDRLYQIPMEEQRNETIRNQFRNNAEGVKALLQANDTLTRHILGSTITALDQLGYAPDTRMTTNGKLFRRKEGGDKAERNALRLYVWLEGLRYGDVLHCFYELYGAAAKAHGKQVQDALTKRYPAMPGKENSPVSFSRAHKLEIPQPYCHLYSLQLKIEPSDAFLAARIKDAFLRDFFEPGYATAAWEAYQQVKAAAKP